VPRQNPTILSFRAKREPALSEVEGNLLFSSFFRTPFSRAEVVQKTKAVALEVATFPSTSQRGELFAPDRRRSGSIRPRIFTGHCFPAALQNVL
jgi:hypothetical protein